LQDFSYLRIRNAINWENWKIQNYYIPKTIESIVSILVEKGYLENFNVEDLGNNKKIIKVNLKYDDNNKSVINELKRISKPGRRIYKGKEDIKRFKNGYGTLIVSTSQGILPNDEAYKRGIGGEVLCSVW